jgi:hypothetical protein
VQLRHGLTMALGSAPAETAGNEVFVGSSQNTSLVAELPCVTVREEAKEAERRAAVA